MTRAQLKFAVAAAGVAAVAALVQIGRAQQAQRQSLADVEIHELPVQGNVHMLVGAGGNITVQVGKQGVLLVDTEYGELSDKVMAAVRKLSGGGLRYIINTQFAPDHTGGNENLRRAGKMVFAGPGAGPIRDAAEGAAIVAHENVLNRMSAPTGSQAPAPAGAWPTETYFGDEHEMFFNGESIRILHEPNAHTDGDSMVYFRRSDVISTGDIFVLNSFPVIDLEKGGSLQGIINGLNRILDIAIPEALEEGGTLIIPGHGRLCDEADVAEYRDMVTIIRDRIQAWMKKGMTLEQIKAARPAREYEPLYGSAPGWSTDQFIEAAYKSLAQGARTAAAGRAREGLDANGARVRAGLSRQGRRA
jgi:cyclase